MRYLVPIFALVGVVVVGMWGYNTFIAGGGNGG